MSSASSAAAVDVALGRSRRAVAALVGLHACAIATLPFAMERGVVMLVLMVALALSLLASLRHPAFGGGAALQRLVWQPDGRWQVHDARGSVEAELDGSSIVRGPVLVLNFRAGRGLRTRILFGDEAPAEPLRRLRARLAWDRR